MVLPAITRRLFMKGLGALAGTKVLPKGLADIATKEAVKKIPYAPPWVSSLVNTLQRSPLKGQAGTKMIPFKVGNNAEIIKLDAKAYRLAQGSGTEKISHFRVKTADYKMYDDVTIAKGEAPPYSWDDIVLTENPKQTSITFKNREFDAGNDQHIVIDKINKETKFIDDNWRMEAGGEDVIKDDWVEYAITPNKNEIALSLKKPVSEINDAVVDGYSVADMDNHYAEMFRSYVDSFSPSGNIFGSVEKMQLKLQKEQLRKLEKLETDKYYRDIEEKGMAEWEEQFRQGFGMHGYSKGGEVKYDYFNDVVPPLEPVDNFQLGGLFKQLLIKKGPKVIEKLREFAPAITSKVAAPKLKKPWAVFDEKGNPIIDFRLKRDANAWLKQEKGATPAGDDYYTKTLNYTIGKIKPKPVKPTQPVTAKPEDVPAMFYRSREEIIKGPPIMSGQQWTEFLGKRGIRDTEMMDTSIGPWLKANSGNQVSKVDLVRKFDATVPEFKVDILGKGHDISPRLQNIVERMDPQAYSPEAGGIIRFMQQGAKNLSDEKELPKFLANTDDLFEKMYGIRNVTSEGIPPTNVSVPYEIKQFMTDILGATRRRGVGMESSAFVDTPKHASSQVLPGASNERELLFRWKPKGPRSAEPTYSYQHGFGAAKQKNAFMHIRVSDRIDEYGNKFIFVEEIQSDMHQPISAALRKMRKLEAEGDTTSSKYRKALKASRYAPRKDVEVATANLEQMANIQRQIERLLATNPKSDKLQKLYAAKEEIRGIEKAKGAVGDTSGIPEGPFKNSQDYMEFAIKYLLRMAKDGNYDGVAFSTPAIKNRGLLPGDKSFRGNLEAYGPILNNAIRKARAKTGADYFETAIQSTHPNSSEKAYYNVPTLMIKGNPKAIEKISKGLPAYKDGGLTKTVPPKSGPEPYGILNDVVPPLEVT
jgi:hypothetical protein